LQGILGLGPLPEQCGTVRDSGHRPARERRRAPWSSASFLAYLGGITILVAVGSLLEVQSGEHGAGGFVGWAALIFVVLTTLAVLAGWSGHRVTSGLFALTSVLAFVTRVRRAPRLVQLARHRPRLALWRHPGLLARAGAVAG
jgi:hypothetical protein